MYVYKLSLTIFLHVTYRLFSIRKSAPHLSPSFDFYYAPWQEYLESSGLVKDCGPVDAPCPKDLEGFLTNKLQLGPGVFQSSRFDFVRVFLWFLVCVKLVLLENNSEDFESWRRIGYLVLLKILALEGFRIDPSIQGISHAAADLAKRT